MAPNLKRLSCLSKSLADLQLIRPKEDLYYTAPPQPSVEDSDSYWAEATPAVDLFSASHMTTNLRRSAVADDTPTTTCSSSDDYWAETTHHAVDEETSASYWAEAAHTPPSHHDDYWHTPAPVHHDDTVTVANYWDERSAVVSASDRYWAEGESTASYWDWRAGEATARDAYWVM